jgi:hypothetical protein
MKIVIYIEKFIIRNIQFSFKNFIRNLMNELHKSISVAKKL